MFGMRVPDGRILLFGDVGSTRDPLYMSIHSSAGVQLSLYALQQGISSTPTYAGTGKSGGSQYPGADFDGTNVAAAYSIHKESIGFTIGALSGF